MTEKVLHFSRSNRFQCACLWWFNQAAEPKTVRDLVLAVSEHAKTCPAPDTKRVAAELRQVFGVEDVVA